MEYRPFPEELGDEFHAFMRYAFSPEQGPWSPEDRDEDRTFLADYRGLFDGDDPVAVCGHQDFTFRIRGADRDAAGLTAVAAPPEHRRRGHVARLLAESLREYRADGVAYSVLWPFEYAFYAKYGWATVSRYTHLKTPPEQLAFAAEAVGDEGSFRRLDADDYAAVSGVLDAMADRYDFTMDRTADWWEHRSLRGWETDPFVYGWERDGELRAFLSYGFDGSDEHASDDGRVMTVRDAAFADEAAWLHLLRFCRNHDSQVDEVRIRAPPDASLLDRVADPRAITEEARAGPMFRLVDVADALERLAPPDGLRAAFALDVSDPLADWNDGAFAVRVDDGAVEVTATPETAGGPDESLPTVACDVGTLSQVYAGYLGVDEAERVGEFDAGDAREPLSALFPPRPTHLREGF